MSFLSTLFRGIAERIRGQNAQTRADEKEFPSGYEVGLRHPQTGAFVLLGDTGTVDLGTGPETHFLLQQANGTASLRAAGISLEGSEVHLHASRLWLHGWQQFDPLGMWTSPPMLPPDPTWFWRFAPFVARHELALAWFLETPFLVGDPARTEYTRPGHPGGNHTPGSGQSQVQLRNWLAPQPLLGPNRSLEILLRNLQALGKEMMIHV